MNGERSWQVNQLLRAALERESGKRGLFLDRDCKGNDEFRREIESLLAENSLGGALEGPMGGGAINLMEPPSSTGLTPGGLLGPYEIEERIGAGGMGEVFRARDTRLHRTVAIKVLPRDRLSDPERKRRFLQEARAVSALNHPNIVTLHDIGNQDGMDFLVMEYVSGQGLDELISPKGLPLGEAIGYTVQMASALAAAHAVGIVHRDIKPANAIVTSEAQVKVLDFGLAKLVDGPRPRTKLRRRNPR